MKKAILIISAVILMTVTGNCQWYKRQYGVNDINQLTQQQLNEALIKARHRVTGGAVLAITGIAEMVGGIALIKYSNTRPGDIDNAFGGAFLILVSVTSEVAGLAMLATNGPRVEEIKGLIKNKELSLGLINCPPDLRFNASKSTSIPCISLSIRF